MNFHYDKSSLTTQSELQVSVADLRDLIQAFTFRSRDQRSRELQMILESVARKNRLQPGALEGEFDDSEEGES